MNVEPICRRAVDGAVELRLVVGAAADEREDLAGARIDGDQRRLRDALRAALAARQDRVDAGEAVAHRVLRVALQVQIERRVDVERAGLRDGARERRVEHLADVVDEVRRLVVDRAGDDRDRLLSARASAASPVM